MCFGCWMKAYGIERTPVRLHTAQVTERCCWCGHSTAEGIYIRIDPRTVPYPTEEE